MPWIKFVKEISAIEVEAGSNLMKALRAHGRPVASSCGGQGVCTKCVVNIVSGKENLSAQNALEKDLREIHDLDKNSRVSCQTSVLGDVVVDTTYW